MRAVNKVNAVILDCPHLAPYIDAQDRIPLTDGHIDIHSSDNHTNASFVGRVSVQVKGKEVRNLDRFDRVFDVKKSALDAYRTEGGVLYLVVFMGRGGGSPKVYYNVLTPYGIDEMLSEMKPGQKTKRISLRKLSSVPERIEAVLNVAFQARHEVSGSRIDPSVLDKITEFTLHTDGSINLDEPVVLNRQEQDFSVSFKTEAGMIGSLDGQLELVPEEYVRRRIDVLVSCGDFTFEKPFRRRVGKGLTELELSPGLKLVIPEAEDVEAKGSVSFKTQQYLEDRYRDLGFLLECADTGEIFFGEAPAKIRASQDPDDLGELRSHFNFLTKLRELIVGVHGNPELINLDELDQKRTQQLEQLKPMLLEGLERKQDIDRPLRLRQPIGDWNLELIFLTGKEPGYWRCVDLLSKELQPCFYKHDLEAPKDEPRAVRVTAYDILDTDELGKCLNLNLEKIVDAYEPFAIDPLSRSEANLTVLKLIQSADKYDIRRDEFLKAAERLNEWLIKLEGEKPLHLLNRFQIKHRTSELDADDKSTLRRIKREASRETSDPTSPVEIACAILLGDVEDSLECFQLLSDYAQSNMKSWPIWNLIPVENRDEEPINELAME